MDIKKVSTFENLIPTERSGGNLSSIGGGPSFKEALNQVEGKKPSGMIPQQGLTEGVKFSNHAVERMMSRGISFNKADMERLSEAVGRAASKGSNNTLVLMNESALIVSVKNKTVVTVMDKNALKENVFTNIDSTVVL